MKLFIALLLVLGLAAGNAFAQGAQGQMVKKRARAISDANNASQGVANPAAAPATPAAPPPRAGIDPSQAQLIEKLAGDLKAISPGVIVPPTQKQTLEDDFLSLAKASVKPSGEALTKLANDLATALADKSAAVKDQPLLAKDINVVLNCAPPLTPAQGQAFITAAQNTLKDSAVSTVLAQKAIDDLKAIIAELQPAKSKQ